MERRGLKLRKALLGSLLPLLRRLPPRTASRLVAEIGKTEYALMRGVRLRVDEAVRQGAHHFDRDWNVGRVGRELAGNQIRWRTRDRLLDGLSDEEVARLFEVAGRDHLDAALAEQRGVVLLCSHFGSHMMPAHWLMRAGYPIRLFMERPRNISRFLSSRFDTDGPTGQKKLFISRRTNPAEAASSIIRAARVLNAGMVLMIAGDVRWSGAHTSPAEFLGKRYTFSNTWGKLAAMTGAPIVPVFCRFTKRGSYRLEFQPTYTVPRGSPEPEVIDGWVQAYLRTVEAQVELDPANSIEYFFWTEPTRSATAAAD